MRRLIVAVVAAGALLAGPVPAHACSCAVRSPAAYLASASAVFRGQVVSVSAAGDGSIALFQVAVVYRGDVPGTVAVRTGGDEAGCGIPFADGGIYVVFAGGEIDALSAHLCGGTSEDRAYLDREGVAAIKQYSAGVASASPSPSAQPAAAPPVSPASRGGPIALAWIAVLAVAGGIARARDVVRAGRA